MKFYLILTFRDFVDIDNFVLGSLIRKFYNVCLVKGQIGKSVTFQFLLKDYFFIFLFCLGGFFFFFFFLIRIIVETMEALENLRRGSKFELNLIMVHTSYSS